MTAAPRQMLSVEEIKDLLFAQRDAVARHYAPAASGSYIDKGGYWTLNPGRPDKSVGSFVVWVDGPKAGRWNDYATGQRGDLLDLIALSQHCDLKTAFREARGFLGLQDDSPEDIARRKKQAERAALDRAQAERDAREQRAKRAKSAFALWLSGSERIKGTPVEAYLRDTRGIDLEQLGRQPRALRYHPECSYEHIDKKTGEVIKGRFPAMLALISGPGGKGMACHRTYLAIGPDGKWGKAPLPEAKKVLGDYRGGSIHLWRGLGPRGGAGKRLSEAEAGSRIYLAEGVEDALSVAMVMPTARVLSVISISNFSTVKLPATIGEVVIVADRDEGKQAKQALAHAVQAHADQGRVVRVWINEHGGKDINDALRQQRAQEASDADDRDDALDEVGEE